MLSPAPAIPLEEDTVYVSTTAILLEEDALFTSKAEFPDLNNSEPDYQVDVNINNNQEQEVFRMVIYPNPSTGYFTLELPDLQSGVKGNLVIISNTGLLVYTQNHLTQVQTINITHAPAGLYLVRIVSGNKLYVVSVLKH